MYDRSAPRLMEILRVAIPVLYWMLECTGCGRRCVVRDSYLKFVGTPEKNQVKSVVEQHAMADEGYDGPPLPERHSCPDGCSQPMRAVGSISGPGDSTMWLHEPHQPIEMDRTQIEEWLRLIREAGLA